jgi:hypothetical protein
MQKKKNEGIDNTTKLPTRIVDWADADADVNNYDEIRGSRWRLGH